MKKAMLSLLIIVLFLASCVQQPQTAKSAQPVVGSTAASSSLPVVNSTSLYDGITEQQKRYLEDYDEFWQILEDNYPFFPILKRKGINVDNIKAANRTDLLHTIENYKAAFDDNRFFRYMTALCGQLNNFAHLSMSDADDYMANRYFINEAKKQNMNLEWANSAEEAIYSEQAVNFYSQMPGYKSAVEYEKQLSISTAANTADEPAEYQIFENEKVGYIKVPSFSHHLIEANNEIFEEFYEKTKNYEHIIIDISNNPGGSEQMFADAIVGPIKGEYIQYNYVFVREGSITSKRYSSLVKEKQLLPMSEFKAFDKIVHADDLNTVDYFMLREREIGSDKTGLEHKAKRWVVVNRLVYSSSEAFAEFCKSTGWATLVGHQTGGDGIGSNPLVGFLSNTGICFKFSSILGADGNGYWSCEDPTMPDIMSPSGVSPLEMCIKEIAKAGVNVSAIKLK